MSEKENTSTSSRAYSIGTRLTITWKGPMAKKGDPLRTVTLRVKMPYKMEHYLWQLVRTGLFGANTGEAAERLIAEGLERRLLKDARSVQRPLLRDVL